MCVEESPEWHIDSMDYNTLVQRLSNMIDCSHHFKDGVLQASKSRGVATARQVSDTTVAADGTGADQKAMTHTWKGEENLNEKQALYSFRKY